jgi:hypothetical protein
MISWVRRARLIVPVAAVALVAAGCVDFTGTKVITGDGVPTGDFVVRITCQIDDQTVTQDLTFSGEETLTSDDFELEDSEGEATCTIEEIEQGGAATWFLECGEIDIDPIILPPSVESDDASTAGGGGPGRSVAPARGDGEEVTCTESPDGHTLTVVINLFLPAEVSVDFTVTNDFPIAPPTTTAPPTPAAVEAVAPTPVPAQVVAFTG